MLGLFKQFLNDPTFAARVLKALIIAAAMAVGTGQVPSVPPIVGAFLAALAALVKSGDWTPTQIKSLSEEDLNKLKKLVQDHGL